MRWSLHPVTRQRWARFRALRRGWWSFWFLVVALGISLLAEWIANDKPLWVRFEGRNYFPVVKFYPEDVFTKNGRLTRPDYKALAASPTFAPGTANRMVWPLIRSGPLESARPEDIRLPDTVTLTAMPQTRVAAVDVGRDGGVVRVAGDADYFGIQRGTQMAENWPADIAAGLTGRFGNEARPAIDAQGRLADGRSAWFSLSPYQPRVTAPARVRVTLRDVLEAPQPRKAVVAARHPAYPATFPVPGTPGWIFTTDKEEVRFPFRPVVRHPLGLDASGRDVAARMLYALRTSLLFGLLLVLATMVLGTALGAAQGYYAGRVDLFAQRFIEIWESLPFIYVLILLGAVYGQGFGLLLGVYAVFNWIGISYYMRAEFLRLRNLPFVEAARVMGLPAHKIIFRHMLPNALVPLVTFLPFSLVGAIGTLAALDYLGFGLPPPTPSWGELLAQAQEFPRAWWLALYPALALFAVMLAGVFTGEGLRAAFDPRAYSRWE